MAPALKGHTALDGIQRDHAVGLASLSVPYANTWAMRAGDTVRFFLQNLVALESGTIVSLGV